MNDLKHLWDRLWPAIQNGSETAFCELMERLYRRYRWTAYRFLHHWDEADDIVQSAFWQLWKKRKTIRGNPAAWFYMTLRNRCIDFQRQRKRQRRFLMKSDESVKEPGLDTERTLDFWRIWNRLSDELGTQQQEVYWMKEILEMSDQTVAEILGISESTVRSHLSLARRRLRKLYVQMFRPPGKGEF